jgi:hypothetical protein
MAIGSIQGETEQRIAILTQEWNIICFDTNFIQQWSYQASVEIPPNHVLTDAAMVISNVSLVNGDRGSIVIVVGMATMSSAEHGNDASHNNPSNVTYMAFSGDKGLLRWKQGPLEFLNTPIAVSLTSE